MPGLNDTDGHLEQAHALPRLADATVFTGLFYRDQIAAYYRASGLPEPYQATARRKIVPETLEQRVLAAFAGSAALFRKTSCAVSYVHGLPDYNGHYGIREFCDICPAAQAARCRSAHKGTLGQPDPPGGPPAARNTGHAGSGHQRAGRRRVRVG